MAMSITPQEVHEKQFLYLIDELKCLVLQSTDIDLQESATPLLEMLKVGIKASLRTKVAPASTPQTPVQNDDEWVSIPLEEPLQGDKPSNEVPRIPPNGIINIKRAQDRLQLSEEDCSWDLARQDVQNAIKKLKLHKESEGTEEYKGKMFGALKRLRKLKTADGQFKWPGFQEEAKNAMILNFIRWEIHLMQENGH